MHNADERGLHLPLAGCYNLRDIGGYPTVDGRRIRRRVVLRSDSLHRLPPESRQALMDYGVRTIIDLRWSGEVEAEPSVFADDRQACYRRIPFYGDKNPYDLDLPPSLSAMYRLDLQREQSNIRAVFEALLEPGALPALIHCAVGKDRTGLIIALLLGLAGVAPDLICEEYARSEEHLAPYFDNIRRHAHPESLARYGYLLECKPEYMSETLAYLHEVHGGAAGYLLAAGLSSEQLERLRAILVE